jgi:hypothetical protein
MTYVALPWFVLIATGSTARMGWVLAAELLPVGLLGILAGSVIARHRREAHDEHRRRGASADHGGDPDLHWTGNLTFAWVLGCTFLLGCFMARTTRRRA